MELLGKDDKTQNPTYATLVTSPEGGEDTVPREPVPIHWIEPKLDGESSSVMQPARDGGDHPAISPAAVVNGPNGEEKHSKGTSAEIKMQNLSVQETGKDKQIPPAASSAADTTRSRMPKKAATTRRIQIDFRDDGLGVYSPRKNLQREKFNPQDSESADERSRGNSKRTIVDDAPRTDAPLPPAGEREQREIPPTASTKDAGRNIPPPPQIKASDLDLRTGAGTMKQAPPEKEARVVEVQQSGVETYLILEDLNRRGTDLLRSGRYEEAISCFESILKRDPENISAYYNKGIILRRLRRWEEALACFDKVLASMPSSPTVWYNKSLTLFHLDHLQEALEAMDQVTAIEPTRAIAWMSRGKILQGMGRISEAEESFTRAEELGYNGSVQEVS